MVTLYIILVGRRGQVSRPFPPGISRASRID